MAYPLRKEKGEDQLLKFLCTFFPRQKNSLQNSAEISIARSRTSSSQIPHQECACLLAVQHWPNDFDICAGAHYPGLPSDNVVFQKE